MYTCKKHLSDILWKFIEKSFSHINNGVWFELIISFRWYAWVIEMVCIYVCLFSIPSIRSILWCVRRYERTWDTWTFLNRKKEEQEKKKEEKKTPFLYHPKIWFYFRATYYILEILKIIFSYLNRYDRQEGSKWLFML